MIRGRREGERGREGEEGGREKEGGREREGRREGERREKRESIKRCTQLTTVDTLGCTFRVYHTLSIYM